MNRNQPILQGKNSTEGFLSQLSIYIVIKISDFV